MRVTLTDLLGDVRAQLPDDKRKVLDGIIDEYGADENCRFMLALMSAATKRERRLAKLLLNELERQEVE